MKMEKEQVRWIYKTMIILQVHTVVMDMLSQKGVI